MEKSYKVDRCINVSIWVNIFLIIIYLIDTIIIFPVNSSNLLTLFAKKPLFLIAIKCCYAFIMLASLISINKKPHLAWFTLNLAAIGVLTLWIFSFTFYTSLIDLFLLELSSIRLLFLSNFNFFVRKYQIKRTFLQFISILIIPILIFGITNFKLII